MKILCVADHVDPIIYSPGLKQRYGDVDLVIGCGDLPLDYYDYIITTLNKPFYFLFGNHNLKHFREFRWKAGPWRALPGSTPAMSACYISGRVRREKTVLIAGLGGSHWYNGGSNQFKESQMFFRILGLLPSLLWNKIRWGRWLDLFIAHAPPFGIGDAKDPCHRGFKSFRWFMRMFKPTYMVHGHIHLYSPETERQHSYQSTTVVNAFNHVLLNLEQRTRR
jgi:hypothetical protein